MIWNISISRRDSFQQKTSLLGHLLEFSPIQITHLLVPASTAYIFVRILHISLTICLFRSCIFIRDDVSRFVLPCIPFVHFLTFRFLLSTFLCLLHSPENNNLYINSNLHYIFIPCCCWIHFPHGINKEGTWIWNIFNLKHVDSCLNTEMRWKVE